MCSGVGGGETVGGHAHCQGQGHGQPCPSVTYRHRHHNSLANCYTSCCAESAKKVKEINLFYF